MFNRENKYYIYNFLIASFLFLISGVPFFKSLNLIFLDKLQGFADVSGDVVIIGIDDRSFKEFGTWPWSDEIFSDFVQKINSASVNTLAFDILFLNENENDYRDFKEQLNNGNLDVVLASKLGNNTIVNSPLAEAGKTLNGFVNLPQEDDGKIRKFNPNILFNNTCYDSFSLTIYKNAKNKLDKNCVTEPIIFNYSNQSFTYYSFVDVYSGIVSPRSLRGKVVLVGIVTYDIKSQVTDNFVDVFGNNTPGVYVHANILNSYLLDRFQEDISRELLLLVVLMLATTSFLIYSGLKKPTYELSTFIIFLLVNILFGLILYEYGVNWDFVTSALILSATFILQIVYKMFSAKNEWAFMYKVFGKYVNENVLKEMVKNQTGKVKGIKRKMTVMFVDIRDFTTYSEKLDLEVLMDRLNEYLAKANEIIIRNNGVIDKYIGDEIMAFWNAPGENENHVEDALKTVLELREMIIKDYVDNAFKVGMSVHTGEMIIGSIGNEERLNYTVLGDNVNLASRVEGLTRKYGVSILITEPVVNSLKNLNDDFAIRKIDTVIVKGRTSLVKIYQPMYKTDENLRIKEIYEKGLAFYYAGDFDKALSYFEQLPNDRPAHLMINRIKNLEDKVKNWDGVWYWEEK
ncbi:hypothetical protein A3A69_00980 [candidate division WWE3 bacterium RIFCSPLOWO2_01_FULL_37_15]|uniref:Guanylate cyclase domain-containing protein n=1 Tax=candidate division WWE3 bacterium RIFCSPLOWO2_01_FULL_37_15 TaxID=1802622 RepID=A0A1F4UZ43_UNCKA|nr:MAG: hypothetical protein A3A69_00980 [candidate division WWE3 bacterium RIFCSPLOWO2_01_FULL_37_15]